jgi:hypothetical protein
MIDVQQQEQINAALTQLVNDPVWQWTDVEGQQRGQKQDIVPIAMDRAADNKSLLEFVSRDAPPKDEHSTLPQRSTELQNHAVTQKPVSLKGLTEEAALLAFVSAPGNKS